MGDTKEKILLAALRLFSREGFEAVSVSEISGALGITKSALYRHYESKRALFDAIVERMEQLDAEAARESGVPEGTAEEMAEVYRNTPLAHVLAFSEAQLRHWTEEEFSVCFRRMLTLEQYRDPEMADLFQQYLGAGPVAYLRELFRELAGPGQNAGQLAIRFYGPLFLLYSLSDGGAAPEVLLQTLRTHMAHFAEELERTKEN